MDERQTYIKFLQDMKPIIEKHDNKVFGKRFEQDIKKVYPEAYISGYAGLQYVYLNRDIRLHIGWDKRPIEATRLLSEIDRIIENEIESMNKLDAENKNASEIESKFSQLKNLIEELDELHYETKSKFKKQFDVDFKTYYRGD